MSQLYSVVAELEVMFKRSFTPDGHMVGSLGEALAAHYYGLTLTPPSTAGCDAIKDGRRIEIKATQGNRVSFRCKPEYLLVMKLEKDGSFEEVYNGMGERVWNTVVHKTMPNNGQHQISLAALRRLAADIQDEERIVRIIVE